MSIHFDPTNGLVVVTARVFGPSGTAYARLALDTGATLTVIRPALLVAAGFDPLASEQRVQMTTGSGVEYVPVLEVNLVEALEREQVNLLVASYTLPPSATVDGLLGLNFLRDRDLLVSFRNGTITLK